eukprot:PLAT9943.1.p2 GENE.PLAT9943.1~~PLAT9943.1.p2  ORF type:complete len:523 (-),score=126.99 PLAT9943.1:71-1639(-)
MCPTAGIATTVTARGQASAVQSQAGGRASFPAAATAASSSRAACSRISKQMDALLSCPGCGCRFEKEGERTPRCLPCGHSVCTACLLDVKGSVITCPSCDKTSSIPDGGVEAIGSNLLVLQMLDAIVVADVAADEPAADEQPCGSCSDTAAAVDCNDCEASLCDACNDDIHSRRCFHKHVRVSLGEGSFRSPAAHTRARREEAKEATCREHRGEPLVLYCCTCDMAVCGYCERYGDHGRHKLVSIRKMAEMRRENLSKQISALTVIARLDSVVDDVTRELRMLTRVWETKAEAITSSASGAGASLDVLESARHKPESWFSGEGIYEIEAAATRVRTTLEAMSEVSKLAELKPLLPDSWQDAMNQLRKATGGSAAIEWDAARLGSGYSLLWKLDEDGTATKTSGSGTMTCVAAKESVEAGTQWSLEVVSIASTADHEIGMVGESQVQTVMNNCWMKGNAQAFFVEFGTYSVGDVVRIEFNGAGTSSFCYRNDSLVATWAVPAGCDKVYPMIAIRAVGGSVRTV